MPLPSAALLAALAFAALSGCGQMGPLYMPTEEATPEKPAVPQETTTQQSDES